LSDIENVCAIAWDAYRLAVGVEPRTFAAEEVVRWIQMRALAQLNNPQPKA
jgi:hypothetical protein